MTLDRLAEQFAIAARAAGWDKRERTAGLCHFIAVAWAWTLYDVGIDYELVAFVNHDAELMWKRGNFVRTAGDRVWCWAPLPWEVDWPHVGTSQYWIDRGYLPLPLCPTCGREPHAGTHDEGVFVGTDMFLPVGPWLQQARQNRVALMDDVIRRLEDRTSAGSLKLRKGYR